jgi:putative ABC transport system substrate-binding protein
MQDDTWYAERGGLAGFRGRLAVGLLVLLSLSLVAHHVGAAERAGPVLIGALTDSWGPTPSIVGLRDGLAELGYRENEQFVIGVRFTQGDTSALPTAARELVRQGVDVLFAADPPSARAAQMATTRIPIVFASGGDPLGMGIVRSFARPGANITGVTDLDLELAPKRLEIFRQLVPGLRRVLLPYDANEPYAMSELRVHRDAARRLGLVLVEKPVRTQDEAQAAFAGVRKGELDGIISPRFLSLNIPGFILEANVKLAIPAMFHTTFWAEQGGLASYGPNFYESGRQAARLVDKILKGANPGGIPVEVNAKLEFAINLKTARALGLAIAPEVLYQANRVFR